MNMKPASRTGTPRIAIVHEWLTTLGGSELVLKEMLAVYPQADLFALVDSLAPSDREALGLTGRTVRTTWMQHIPGIARRYRQLLPLMPNAMRGLQLDGYDVVISNTHAVAHRVRVPRGATHLVHCHSPMRYAWDLREQYLSEAGLDHGLTGAMARATLNWIRRGDARAAKTPHAYAAISEYIRDRIRRCYGRTSTLIYSPADVEYFTPGGERGNFYLAASRMVPYKKLPMIAEAFTRHLPDHELVIIGDGPEMGRVRGAAGKNVRILGAQPREVLRDYLRRARAFVFAADEDFGILPVEAQACGTPVIAYGVGGARETVREGETGVFFSSQTSEAVAAAVGVFERSSHRFTSAACRANAERFSTARFRREFREWVEGCIR
ncbi:MAG: glycosyltransferase [Gemmatimonadaceae bacterium]|jgi:glycosyltransferase involved in cell wall biosynthesis